MMKAAGLIRIMGCLPISVLVFACNNGDVSQVLVPECIDPGEPVPTGEWVCGDEKIVECTAPTGTPVHTIYVQLESGTCADAELDVSVEGPFPLGSYEIDVSASVDGVEGVLLCTSTLTVVDTVGPVVEPKTTELWPPNHKFHTITVDDCVDVVDVCDPHVDVTFTYATSDEPRNDTGDGNTEVDIENFSCKSVDLLAERKGNGDARVYTLGFEALDASGNVTLGECHVIVPHDQGGKVSVDSGEVYREDAPDCE